MYTLNAIHECTAQGFLRALPENYLDLMITDPPYGIGYKSGCVISNGGKSRNTSNSFGEDVIQLDWIPDAYRTLKDDSALYLFTRWDVLHIWKSALEDSGFKVIQRIVWDKLHWTGGNLDYYGSQTEDILFAVKGNHQLRWSKREGNMWRLTKLDTINHEGNYDNPTQKPQRLIERAILRSSNPGDLVADPFVGSGTTAAAALATKRRFIAADIDPKQCQIARERIGYGQTVSMFEL